MEPFTTLTAIALPLDQPNLDTDQIIPARFLGRPRPAQAEGLFHGLRFDGEHRSRAQFVTNMPAYQGAQIIVANRNFGCGSSRESAVTVMVDNGLRSYVAPSFGDIFYNNCFQNGALPIRLDEDRVAAIRAVLHTSPGAKITIDLAGQTIVGPDSKTDHFDIDPFRKDCLLRGVDEIDLTLSYEAKIALFELRLSDQLSRSGRVDQRFPSDNP
jgi:3-isopropylmalate/(R)-2-methylmalate dehydratase small subunit